MYGIDWEEPTPFIADSWNSGGSVPTSWMFESILMFMGLIKGKSSYSQLCKFFQ